MKKLIEFTNTNTDQELGTNVAYTSITLANLDSMLLGTIMSLVCDTLH